MSRRPTAAASLAAALLGVALPVAVAAPSPSGPRPAAPGDPGISTLERSWARLDRELRLLDQLWSDLIASYRTLLRLPRLPRQHEPLAAVIAAEVGLLEAVAARLELSAGCWPRPPGRLAMAEGDRDPLAVACSQLLLAVQGFEAAWRATP